MHPHSSPGLQLPVQLAQAPTMISIDLEEVTPVDLKPKQFVNALSSGEVDALIAENL